MKASVVTVYLKDKTVKSYLLPISAAEAATLVSKLTGGSSENIRIYPVIQKDLPSFAANILDMKNKGLF